MDITALLHACMCKYTCRSLAMDGPRGPIIGGGGGGGGGGDHE